MEEIQAEITDLRYLFMVENIFTFNGEKHHEIVLVYDGRLKDESLYSKQVIQGWDGIPIRVEWESPEEFGPGKVILYREGLLERLQETHA